MAVTVFSSSVDGVIAALLGPLFMSLGFFIWDMKWTSCRGSAFALNMYKCNVASVWFAIMAGIRGFSQSEYSSVFTVTSVGFLTLSSTLGIIIGDVLWLEALRLLGAKHVIVADSLKPFAAAILGRYVLDEALHPASWGGMVLTVIGVATVAWEGQNNIAHDDETSHGKNRSISIENVQITGDSQPCNEIHGAEIQQPQRAVDERESNNDDLVHTSEKKQQMKEYQRGYICAAVNVLADATGSLWTKKYGVGMTTWSINLIRFGFAGIVLFFVSVVMRLHRRCSASDNMNKTEDAVLSDATVHVDNTGNTVHSSQPMASSIDCSDPKWFELPSLTRQGWLQITMGVALVTFLCPALEKFALMQVAMGLCVSLGSVGPLYGVLMDWSFKGRKPTIIVLVGVVLAIGGVIILCAFGT
ncbi:hypothetical protein HJC23_008440 [Cyclotella cryptica]|uniref:EamA domain-containing protein n=1 Tax=Cyclotella cryptica TaxID=29204 RepID=A0ABD3NKI0_9STRA|eukprot:CCRYP_020617-RA/>CCRYP_020617-RA protein AED:0.01 eAED:-0.00 QI:0/-1/0/1/-1/1/1/0/414